MKNIDSIQEKIKSQDEYCSKMKYPFFAPRDGICWSCNKQIFDKLPIEKCKNELITGCPYCHRSYVD